MKKILFLLCVYTTMGFTRASENSACKATAEAAPKQLFRSYGYLETSSPGSYTITP